MAQCTGGEQLGHGLGSIGVECRRRIHCAEGDASLVYNPVGHTCNAEAACTHDLLRSIRELARHGNIVGGSYHDILDHRDRVERVRRGVEYPQSRKTCQKRIAVRIECDSMERSEAFCIEDRRNPPGSGQVSGIAHRFDGCDRVSRSSKQKMIFERVEPDSRQIARVRLVVDAWPELREPAQQQAVELLLSVDAIGGSGPCELRRIDRANAAAQAAYDREYAAYEAKLREHEKCTGAISKDLEKQMAPAMANAQQDRANMEAVAARVKAAKDAGNMAEVRRLVDSLAAAVNPGSQRMVAQSNAATARARSECGDQPVKPASPARQSALTWEDVIDAGAKASRMSREQYAIFRERVAPFVLSNGKSSNMMYTASEVGAMKAKSDALGRWGTALKNS